MRVPLLVSCDVRKITAEIFEIMGNKEVKRAKKNLKQLVNQTMHSQTWHLWGVSICSKVIIGSEGLWLDDRSCDVGKGENMEDRILEVEPIFLPASFLPMSTIACFRFKNSFLEPWLVNIFSKVRFLNYFKPPKIFILHIFNSFQKNSLLNKILLPSFLFGKAIFTTLLIF